jgi:hypothetical protein
MLIKRDYLRKSVFTITPADYRVTLNNFENSPKEWEHLAPYYTAREQDAPTPKCWGQTDFGILYRVIDLFPLEPRPERRVFYLIHILRHLSSQGSHLYNSS